MAARTQEEGGPIYLRWITWVWQGEVPQVIAELAARAAELGSPPTDASEADPRQILADQLSDTQPLPLFWTRRSHAATGTRTYTKA
jgi:hypothetical protein